MNKSYVFAFAVFGALMLTGCTIGEGEPDGGIYKSSDGGKSFQQKVKIDDTNDFGSSDVLSLEIDPQNTDTLYIGTRDEGIMRSTDGGETWVRDINNFTLVSSIIVDPGSPQTIYIAAVKGSRGKIFKTSNGGEAWVEIFTEKSDGPRMLAMAIDHSNTNILYAGDTLGGIYKSEDAGVTWKTVLWAKSSVRDIAMDRINPSLVYFATTNSGALVTNDAGRTFSSMAVSGSIYNIETHPTKGGAVFLSNSAGLQVSFDAGVTWAVINTLVKPTDLGSRGIAIDPIDDNVIYYASGKAFYKSVNRGESWSMVQFDVSRSIDLIKINPKDTNIIYLGLANRKTGSSLLMPSL